MAIKILVVESDKRWSGIYKSVLGKNYDYAEFNSPEEAVGSIDTIKPDIVLLELKNDTQNSGLKDIETLKRPWNKIIAITDFDDTYPFERAIDNGASEFIEKDSNLTNILKIRVDNIARTLFVEEDLQQIEHHELGFRYHEKEIMIGTSRIMKKLFAEIKKKAGSDDSVLITGQSGVGKELVARALHFKSQRKGKPFVSINAAAIPEDIIETNLFGYEKGAFTGADKTTIGILDEADGSTLFVDEFHHLTPAVQAKLLRILGEHEYLSVGGTKAKKVDVRFIFATNENPEELVQSGAIRQDFYFRINQLRIHVPNLQARKDDIPWLANHFLKEINQSLPPTEKFEFSREAIDHMVNHDWPGNIRELKNTIKRAVMDCTDRFIRPQQLNLSIISNPSISSSHAESASEFIFSCPLKPMGETEKQFKKTYLSWVLKQNHNDKSKTAFLLGISLKTLSNYLKY
jgi:two-component system response regulator AtoC